MNSPPQKPDSPAQAPPFKEQLDQKAIESREHENDNEGNSIIQTVLHKISQAIPATVPIVGGSNPDGKVENEEELAAPPHRPENDPQIAEFVRDQHRSNNGVETLSAGKA
ncbi:hypothetical protein ACHAQJ_005019 [Trichoderma viride]